MPGTWLMLHKLVSHFRRSPGAAQVLKEKQELLGFPVRKLIQDVRTRWNSAHDMLSHNTLSTDEVVIAEAAVELLEPFKMTMTLMCSGTQPTYSITYSTNHIHITDGELVPQPGRQQSNDEDETGDQGWPGLTLSFWLAHIQLAADVVHPGHTVQSTGICLGWRKAGGPRGNCAIDVTFQL